MYTLVDDSTLILQGGSIFVFGFIILRGVDLWVVLRYRPLFGVCSLVDFVVGITVRLKIWYKIIKKCIMCFGIEAL